MIELGLFDYWFLFYLKEQIVEDQKYLFPKEK